MTSLGYSYMGNHNHNQILQPNIPGGANPSNSHFTDPYPQFSSKVEAVAGCGGSGGSASALNAYPGYTVEKQTGGSAHRRGGYKKRRSNSKKSRTSKSKSKKCKKRCMCRGTCHCRRQHRKRSMRGGMSSLSPAPFSGGANAPYHQFMGGEPVSYNFGIGSANPLPLDLIGTAPNHMMNIHNNCGPNNGMVSKGLIL